MDALFVNLGEEEAPLLVDCLTGIEEALGNVLVCLRNYYNVKNRDSEERERTYVFMLHRQLNTAIIVCCQQVLLLLWVTNKMYLLFLGGQL